MRDGDEHGGEVDSFEAVTVQEFLRRVTSAKYKRTSVPIALDFLVRRGILTPETEPQYPALLELLHAPLHHLYTAHPRPQLLPHALDPSPPAQTTSHSSPLLPWLQLIVFHKGRGGGADRILRHWSWCQGSRKPWAPTSLTYESYPLGQDAENYHYTTQGGEGEFREGGHYPTYSIPEEVKKYITYFRDAIRDGNVYDVPSLYIDFNRLTEEYYKTQSWPEVEDLYGNKLVEQDGRDDIFLILYRELYYRHIYARVQGGPTIPQRFESYYNYCNLFNYILSAETPVPLELPNQWLWEIIDEFIYQFQSFSQFRSKLGKKSEPEIELLKDSPKIWNVHSVLNVLHCLVDKSNINQQLEVYTSGGDPDSVAGEFGRHPLYKMLGYFSLIGLLRLHSLLGDYYQAIKGGKLKPLSRGLHPQRVSLGGPPQRDPPRNPPTGAQNWFLKSLSSVPPG
ncbi:Eukaryotic translation initiation factor 3 subunit L [Chionoecetes opilio]|uniref:Eukaryotic translation initiation factor 3 subunit L n=1 Tax=Chionoecetes opilio TaxID=41210 RepID=A0A8J4YND8_CHIOP|nr:Eukaryotic translation initiation factor 3 subunit L [Chionoecetes opilio]